MWKIIPMYPDKRPAISMSVRVNSRFLVDKYLEVLQLTEDWVPGAEQVRRQLFAALLKRAGEGDPFIESFLSKHE